jgi:hypothetical protein
MCNLDVVTVAASRDGNKAIAQCGVYISHFQEYIDAVRSNIRVDALIQPRGAVLLIGNSATENEKQRQYRANFVRATPSIDVVSYQRILSALESDLMSRSSCSGSSAWGGMKESD